MLFGAASTDYLPIKDEENSKFMVTISSI